MADWPGVERRKPRRSGKDYLILHALARVLQQEVDRTLGGRTDLKVLDIGCGEKPYYPFFAENASEYRGIDLESGPLVDDIGPIEALPYPESSFDVVLCTQVLEHVDDPTVAIREIHRVLRPGGTVFLSTHGVFVYHPNPVDLWRWTIGGLERQFRNSAEWGEIRVTPNGEAVVCLGYLANQYVIFLPMVGRWLVWAINSAAELIDPRFPAHIRGDAEGSLSANFLVTAIKA